MSRKLLLTSVVFLAAFYFTHIVVGVISSEYIGKLLQLVIAVLCASALTRAYWTSSNALNPTSLTLGLKYSIMWGAVCFIAGFFLPIIFSPGNNLAPIRGFVICLLGAIFGSVFGLLVSLGHDFPKTKKK